MTVAARNYREINLVIGDYPDRMCIGKICGKCPRKASWSVLSQEEGSHSDVRMRSSLARTVRAAP